MSRAARGWFGVVAGVVALATAVPALAAVGAGVGLPLSSVPSVAAPSMAGSFTSLAPSRVLDTRKANGASGPVQGRGTIHVQVLGRGGVPASNVSAVVVNVTVTSTKAAGYITVYPDGTTMPNASNLNFTSGLTVPNLVVVKVGADGKIALTNNSAGTVQLVGDVAGYFLAGTPVDAGAFTSLAPSRVLDTRKANGASGPVQGRGTIHVQVLGRGGVPASNVSAVVVNVTVTSTKAAGYITVYPDGTTMPNASNLNFTSGLTVPNLVVVKVGADGKIALTNNSAGTVQLVGDVAGYFLAGTPVDAGAFTSLAPSRVLDTRKANGASGPVQGRGTIHVQVLGRGGVPASNVSAVVVNVTVTSTKAAGYITVYPDGTTMPNASNLNFTSGLTVPNLVVVKVGADGKIALTNNSAGTVQLVGDVAGYYLATDLDSTPPGPVTGLTATPASTSVSLSWTNPTDADFAGVMIRRAQGMTAPASPTAGTLVVDTAKSATGFTNVGLAAGTTYSFALFAHDPVPNFAAGVDKTVTTTTPDITPPGPVTSAQVVGTTSSSIALSWTNPVDTDFTGVMIRRAQGTTAPASPTAGTLVVDTAKSATSYTNGGLAAGTTYSYALFAHDAVPNYSASATLSASTSASNLGAVSGTVTEAGGAHHGLANVWVHLFSPTPPYDNGSAYTAADGTYTIGGLTPEWDYKLSFTGSAATGGSSDAYGYVDEYYDNQPLSGGWTLVSVSAGTTHTGLDAALATGGVITGTVTDAGGTHHGLANVGISAFSASTGAMNWATTGADGSYTIPGLPTAGDYQVRTYSSGATGGSSDATGYVDQWWHDQPISGTPTPVTVTQGAITTGIDAALVGKD